MSAGLLHAECCSEPFQKHFGISATHVHMAPYYCSAILCFGSGDLFSFSSTVARAFLEQLIQDAATILLFTSTPQSLIILLRHFKMVIQHCVSVFQGSS